MRICLVCAGYPPHDGGGIGVYTKTLAEGLVECDQEVVVLCVSNSDDSQSVEAGVTVRRVNCSRYLPILEKIFPGISASYHIYRALKKMHEATPFDVVEFPNWEALGLVSQLLMRKLPFFVRVHTPYFETLEFDKGNVVSLRDQVMCAQEKWSCKNAAQLVSSTKNHANLIAKRYSLPVSCFTILPLGIRDRHSRKSVEEKLSQKHDQFKILYVSRLENRKGTLLLLDALPAMLKGRPEVYVDFVGKDRPHAPGNILFREYFEKHYAALSNQVSFHGYIDDEALDDFYRGADLFVVPSWYESFGLIYAEAMMFGLPCIATDGGGISEVVSHGLNGTLLKNRTIEELSAAVNSYYMNRERMDEVALVARSSYENQFKHHIMVERTLKSYENLGLRA